MRPLKAKRRDMPPSSSSDGEEEKKSEDAEEEEDDEDEEGERVSRQIQWKKRRARIKKRLKVERVIKITKRFDRKQSNLVCRD